MNRFMPRFTQKDLINLFLGKLSKKRGRTGSQLDMSVQRGEPVRAALVHMLDFFCPMIKAQYEYKFLKMYQK